MLHVTAIVSKITNRQSLVQGNEYEVIGFGDSYLRIIDQAGEPAIYPKSYFLDVNIIPPNNWVLKRYDDGEYTCDPPMLSAPGFYEDYADDVESAKSLFQTYKESLEK